MQGRREIRKDSKNPNTIFDSFGDFGSSGSMFQHSFGGRVPFDDPFFTRPFGRAFRSDMFRTDQSHLHKMKGPIIEEIHSDDEQSSEEKEGNGDGNEGYANKNPIVEHPDDHEKDAENPRDIDSNNRGSSLSINDNKVNVTEPKTRSVSFHRVTYGGINGNYYTSTTSRRTGQDGITIEESREADKTTGEAKHKISRGIHQKGHSVTRKLDSKGKVETVQTLHNLNEDELVGFDDAWKISSSNQNWTSFPSISDDAIGERGARRSGSGQPQRQNSKNVVRINIE